MNADEEKKEEISEKRIVYAKTETTPCIDCGGMTIPTGSCTTCIQCGSTNGCG